MSGFFETRVENLETSAPAPTVRSLTKKKKNSKKRKAVSFEVSDKDSGSEYKFDLLKGVKSYHAKLFPIPKIHKATLKTEVNRLINIGVLKDKNISKWAAPTFINPKMNGTVFHF